MRLPFITFLLSLLLIMPLCIQAAEPTKSSTKLNLEEAIKNGIPSLALRLRGESVEQDNVLEDGNALTLRARLGYTTANWRGLSAGLEFEVVEAFGGEAYNSGPGGNGKTTRSVIADPEGEEVNRLWLQYDGIPKTRLKIGRQRIIFDNARFVGNVGWRQNEQTYDAALLQFTGISDLKFTYAFVTDNNNIFFDDMPMRSHLANINIWGDRAHSVTAYAYLLDFIRTGVDQQTIGLRAKGSFDLNTFMLGYSAEYADQSDYADAPSSVDADYTLLELTGSRGGFKGILGYEVLSGDGVYAFSTPLATLHAFNGWADVFLRTPLTGLQDRYIGGQYAAGQWVFKAFYHDFVSDAGGIDHGSEIDLLAVWKIKKNLKLLAKYADYSADQTAVGTERVFLQMEYGF